MRQRLGLCSERAIARVIPAIPAPMMAMLRGGVEEPMVLTGGICSEIWRRENSNNAAEEVEGDILLEAKFGIHSGTVEVRRRQS